MSIFSVASRWGVALAFVLSVAQAAEPDGEMAEETFVITATSGDAGGTGGSAHLLDTEDLEETNYADIDRILRAVPGVYLQEEDGFGLRPNIGLRGSGLDRSANIALMEDGVPIAPAPYAAPSAYYFPRAGRMSGIEVTKGVAAIVYGPMTTGGAIHMFSTPVPDEFAAYSDTMFGEDGRFQSHNYIGGMVERGPDVRVGGLLESFIDQSDGFKDLDGADTGFEIEDYVGRFRIEMDNLFGFAQTFEFKGQASEEDSNETYLGLTQADFDATPFMRYRGSQVDSMENEHGLVQLTHTINLSDSLRFISTAYRTEFQRNWYKLDRVVDPSEGSTSISSILSDPVMFDGAMEILRGADGFVSADNALRVKANNRSYWVEGLQTTAQLNFTGPFADHFIDASVRYHEDEMDRFQWVDGYRMDNGTMVLTTPGTPGTDSNRIDSANAWAFFLRDEMTFGALTVTPGVRVELIELTRHNYGTADPNRTGVNLTVSRNDVDVFIPGVGATYDATDRLTLLAGVHRGFTPPAPGSSAGAEDSTNWEMGARWFGDFVYAEAIGFFTDYDNLVGTCTGSTGGNCTIGDQFSGGEVRVVGLEALANAELPTLWPGVTAPIGVSYTFTEAQFDSSFKSGFGPWGTVTSGDELPYVPEHQLTLNAGLRSDIWRVGVIGNYVSETRATAGQGTIPLSEQIEARWVTDLTAGWTLVPGAEIYARVDNLFDETYVASRRPAGLRPGLPRTAMVGIRLTFEEFLN